MIFMDKRKHSALMRLAALFLAVMMFLPMGAKATEEAVQPRASDYLDNYNAYVYSAGWGYVRVYFDVTGNGYQEALGALTISVYESKDNATWTCVQTYNHDQHSQMMSYHDNYHSGYVEYDGVIGRYYKAYVCIWGGGLEVGDARYFYTSAKKATLFAE